MPSRRAIMFNREPIVWIQTVQGVVIGFLPVSMAFNLLDWSVEQYGVVEGFIILVAMSAGALVSRNQVTPWPVVPESLTKVQQVELKTAVLASDR